jgi:hypothetical protein
MGTVGPAAEVTAGANSGARDAEPAVAMVGADSDNVEESVAGVEDSMAAVVAAVGGAVIIVGAFNKNPVSRGVGAAVRADGSDKRDLAGVVELDGNEARRAACNISGVSGGSNGRTGS